MHKITDKFEITNRRKQQFWVSQPTSVVRKEKSNQIKYLPSKAIQSQECSEKGWKNISSRRWKENRRARFSMLNIRVTLKIMSVFDAVT